MNQYDVGVIGAGPGGYVCAIKLAQLGKKVVCFDGSALGGTCLNRGCITSKFLLNTSHILHSSKVLEKFGLTCSGMNADLPKMQDANMKNISDFNKGIAGLFKKNGVKFVNKNAKIKDKNTIIADKELFNVEKIVLATGSKVSELPNIKTNGKNVITSDEALFLTKIPKSITIIGGGVIGVEFASIWSRFGSAVRVVEFLDEILPGLDGEIRKSARNIFKKQGIEFVLNHKAMDLKANKSNVILTLEDNKTQKTSEIDSEIVIVCVGRRPNVDLENLKSIGISTDKRDFINVNCDLQTDVNNIYAIGDITKGPMLAHKAEEDGVFVAEKIAGQKPHLDYNLIPAVVYTHPEIASIGKTEEQLKSDGIEYKVGKFPFMANSRAKTVKDFDGFVKILTCKKYDTILGAHIMGPQAGTLIGELVVAMNYGASSEDIARICHSHPDLNETIKEACLASFLKPIHI